MKITISKEERQRLRELTRDVRVMQDDPESMYVVLADLVDKILERAQ